MFSWTRNFYAERDGVFYQFEKKSNRDDAERNDERIIYDLGNCKDV